MIYRLVKKLSYILNRQGIYFFQKRISRLWLKLYLFLKTKLAHLIKELIYRTILSTIPDDLSEVSVNELPWLLWAFSRSKRLPDRDVIEKIGSEINRRLQNYVSYIFKNIKLLGWYALQVSDASNETIDEYLSQSNADLHDFQLDIEEDTGKILLKLNYLSDPIEQRTNSESFNSLNISLLGLVLLYH